MTSDPYELCPVCCKENGIWERAIGRRNRNPLICWHCSLKYWTRNPAMPTELMFPIPYVELFDD